MSNDERLRKHARLLAAVLAATFTNSAGTARMAQAPAGEVISAVAAEKCREVFAGRGMTQYKIDQLLESWEKLAPEVAADLRRTRCGFVAYPARQTAAAAVERGRSLYSSHGCAWCHGQNIRGGEGGPSLLRSPLVMRDVKGETIAEVVLKGVPNTAMRAFPLKQEELADLAEFLHSFPSSVWPEVSSPAIVGGHAPRGRRYFNRKCSSCHSATGDLAGIAVKYSDPMKLQGAWLMPTTASPMTATISTSEGTTIQGRVLYRDEFWMTLALPNGAQRTFERHKGRDAVLHDELAGHEALLPQYADQDIHDVTAFLLTLEAQPREHRKQASAESRREMAEGAAQRALGLEPAEILHPIPGSWPTATGDYSGRRYSDLKQINQSNVKGLTLAWAARLAAGRNDAGRHPVLVDGVGDQIIDQATLIRGSMLTVDGVLYTSMPDNAWAVDARNGRILWHFIWKSRGGHHFSNRGVAMSGTSIFMATPDNYLVALDALTGRKRWQVETANFDEQYFSSAAPVVIGNRVLVGSSTTLNGPGYLQAFDTQTGEAQWRRYSVPMNPADAGIETWKDVDAARHGGGSIWNGGVYDPETNLYIYGTGNPTPAYTAESRGDKDALFTCSMLAVDVDSGKLVWYYQVSPNDTHDWDAVQTPVLADLKINGKVRKVAMTAARNGYFFVVDRTSGEHILTSKFSVAANWAAPGLNAAGQPVRLPEKDSHVSGALVSPANAGAANWFPASYSPDYDLYYVQTSESWAMYYQTSFAAGGNLSEEGKKEETVHKEFFLRAIDPRSGRTAWSVQHPPATGFPNGLLTTAGRLLFSGDTVGNFSARDPATGEVLWHTALGAISNAPQTYMVDERQYIIVTADDTLYAFTLGQ
jgi:alcohol dehydrogenase (cytochrome c)